MRLLARALLFCSLLPAFASAQMGMVGIGVDGGIHGGLSFISPSQDLKDIYGTGYGGGVHLDLSLPAGIAFRLSGDYFRHPSDKSKFAQTISDAVNMQPGGAHTAASDFDVAGGDISIITVSANVIYKLLPTPVVSPYITGGIGYNFLSASDVKITYLPDPSQAFSQSIPSENKPGIDLGVGVQGGLGPLSGFVEARYVLIFTSNESTHYIPVVIGVNF